MAEKQAIATPSFPVRIQAFYNGFKVEFDFTTDEKTIGEIQSFCDGLVNGGFKPTTFEKKPDTATQVVDQFGKVEKVEKTTTKNGKEAYIAHIMCENSTPVEIMFFGAGSCRKGDRVKIFKNDSGYLAFYLVDENGERLPF